VANFCKILLLGKEIGPTSDVSTSNFVHKMDKFSIYESLRSFLDTFIFSILKSHSLYSLVSLVPLPQ